MAKCEECEHRDVCPSYWFPRIQWQYIRDSLANMRFRYDPQIGIDQAKFLMDYHSAVMDLAESVDWPVAV